MKAQFFPFATSSGRWNLASLNVRVGEVTLRNPVMPASGCFAIEYSEALDFNKLGALVIKSVSPKCRAGNPTPRVTEAYSGMLNSIGIPSKGLQHYRESVLPPYTQFDTPVVVSISADTVDEFADAVAEMSLPDVAVIEANISCPNLEADGMAFAMTPETTGAAAEVPVYAEATLVPGTRVEGPCIIDVGDTTIYLPTGSSGVRDRFFNFSLTLGASK